MGVDFPTLLRAFNTYKTSWSICLATATLALGLRLYTRAKILGRLSWDDWVMMLAWVFFAADYGIMMATTESVDGIFADRGFHLATVEALIRADGILYVVCMMFAKISVGLFFFVFGVDRPKRILIYAVVGFTSAYSVAYCFFTAFSCAAVSTLVFLGGCRALPVYKIFQTSVSCVNGVADLAFALLSMRALWTVQLPLRTKILATVVLLLGTVAGAASFARGVLIYEAFAIGGYVHSVNAGLWTALEMCIGITAPSLACLRPLLRVLNNKARQGLNRAAPGTEVVTGAFNTDMATITRQNTLQRQSLADPYNFKASNFIDMRLSIIEDPA